MSAAAALESLRAHLSDASACEPAASAKPLAAARRLLPLAQKALSSSSARAALAASVFDASGLAALGSGDGESALNFFLDALRQAGDSEDASAFRARRLLNVGTALGRLARHSEARDFALAAVDTAANSQDAEVAALLPVAWFNAAAASEFLGDLPFARALYTHGASLVELGSELDAAFALALSEVESAIAYTLSVNRAASLAEAQATVGSLAADIASHASTVTPAIDADTSHRIVEPALPQRYLGTAGLRGDHRPPYPRALEQNMRVLGIGQPKVDKPRPEIVRRPQPPRQSLFKSSTTTRSKDDTVALHPAASPVGGRPFAGRSPLAVSPRATIKMNAAGKALALECRPDFIALVPSPRPSPRADAELRLNYVRPQLQQQQLGAESQCASGAPGPCEVVDTLHVRQDGTTTSSMPPNVPRREFACLPDAQSATPVVSDVAGYMSSDLSIIERCQERLREAFAAVERSVIKRRGSDS